MTFEVGQQVVLKRDVKAHISCAFLVTRIENQGYPDFPEWGRLLRLRRADDPTDFGGTWWEDELSPPCS